LDFDKRFLGPPTMAQLVVLSVVSNFAFIILMSRFENLAILIVLIFGLKLPNHANFLRVLTHATHISLLTVQVHLPYALG